jgi:signal transduction histidine kinase
MQMFQSATLKLTLYYLGIITVICIAFSAVLYHFASAELHRSIYGQSTRITEEFPGFDFDPALRPGSDYTRGTHRLIANLLYFNIIVLAVAGIASYALAKQTLEPIREAHDKQKRFTSDVSHELRTPLTGLKMTSEVALMDAQASKNDLKQALTSNLEDAARLEQLINNLFRLSRLDAEEVTQSFSMQRLQPIVETAIAAAQTHAKERSITLSADIPAKLAVLGDRDSLAQMLTVFLDNAIKYSPEGSTVNVKATGGELVTLKVIDQGIGIEKKALPHLFDRFYRADNARTRTDASGFGLGLSIAKHIADLHHANIQIASKPGHGTVVTVMLPNPS